MIVPTGKLALGLVFLALVVAGAAVGIALLTAPSLPPETTQTARAPQPSTTRSPHRGRSTGRHRHQAPARRGGDADGGGPIGWLERRSLVELIAIALGGGTVVGLLGGSFVVVRTVRRRIRKRNRSYERYELRLSAHDEAEPKDLEAAVETMVGIVRERADVRWHDGQPWFAFELHCSPSASGELEWTICIVCEPRVVSQLDAALASAYPDVRIGHEFVAAPEPIDGGLRRPACVERLRKHRSFVFALGREPDRARAGHDGAPLVELIAQAQVAAAAASTVRLTLTPTLHAVERLAAALARGEANRSAREGRWGAAEAGLRAPQRRRELEGAERTQNRSLCWFELLVASDDADACRTVTAAVQSLRGGNRLHRRIFELQPQRLRDRFVRGDPPLLPVSAAAGLRSLISSAEIATLIELPTARMRGVPVRRLMLPRIPAPPDALRARGTLDEPPSDTDPFDPAAVVPSEPT